MNVSNRNTVCGVKRASWIFALSAVLVFIFMGGSFASDMAPSQVIQDAPGSQGAPGDGTMPVQPVERPTVVINPDSTPLSLAMILSPSYNEYTKHYYLLRSYLERFEETDGGTLILQAGVYNIPRVLFVTSNTTIILEDGARLVKTSYTGTDEVKPTKSIFQLIRPSKASGKSVYRGYDGEHDIAFKGSGSAAMDLGFYREGLAIVAGHNRNVTIEGIRFENNNGGHFIEMDANRDAIIRNNSFVGSMASANENKEAINLDTPDKSTRGFNCRWSSHDRTPNMNVLIESNYFSDLDRAIGTHKYSDKKYHTNIRVVNNTIDKTRREAIRVMNWKDSVIERNIISNAGTNGNPAVRGILASGAMNPTFRYNTFISVNRTMQFMPWKNVGGGEEYPVTYNVLTSQNKDDLKSNRTQNVKEKFVRITYIAGVYDKFLEKVELSTWY